MRNLDDDKGFARRFLLLEIVRSTCTSRLRNKQTATPHQNVWHGKQMSGSINGMGNRSALLMFALLSVVLKIQNKTIILPI